VIVLTVDAAENVLAGLDCLRRYAFEEVGGGIMRCKSCGATGEWPDSMAHGTQPDTPPPRRECRVARSLGEVAGIARQVVDATTRAADAPVIGEGQ
jgi:hypothetical protein